MRILTYIYAFIFFSLLVSCGQTQPYKESRELVPNPEGYTKDFDSSLMSDTVLIKTRKLKTLLSQADTLTPEETYSDTTYDIGINNEIGRQLIAILTIPTIVNYNLDSLLEHPFLNMAHSKDKRLWIFSWRENTGGTFKSSLNLIHYRTKSNKPKVVADFLQEKDEDFDSNGGSFYSILPLKSTSSSIYLCLGRVGFCGTCCAEIASVLELTDDSINIHYNAFSDDLENEDHATSSVFVLDSRCESIKKFEFEEKTQAIFYVYETDDNTPIVKDENEKSKTIKGMLKWNGNSFAEPIKGDK